MPHKSDSLKIVPKCAFVHVCVELRMTTNQPSMHAFALASQLPVRFNADHERLCIHF